MPTLAAWEHQSSHGGEDFGIQLGSSSIYLTSSLESSVSVSTFLPHRIAMASRKLNTWRRPNSNDGLSSVLTAISGGERTIGLSL